MAFAFSSQRKRSREKKKLYKSIKRLCFYISYKIILHLLILHTEDRRKKKEVAYSFFKLSDLLLVCNDKKQQQDNTIWCEKLNGNDIRYRTRE